MLLFLNIILAVWVVTYGADHIHWECCVKDGIYGASEEADVEKWYNEHKHEWETIFEQDFHLWEEFDIRRSPTLATKIRDSSPDSPGFTCKSLFQGVRWDLGSEIANPDLWDWDDKIAKKSVVAYMQPDSDPHLWYTPSIYEAYHPGYHEQGGPEALHQSLARYFQEHNGTDKVFLKSAVGGMGSSGLQKCTRSAKPGPLFTVSADVELETLRHCVQRIHDDSQHAKGTGIGNRGVRNPAIENGWPGLQVEGGVEFDAEFKTVVIWGRFFAGGTETPHCCGFFSRDFVKFRGGDNDTRTKTIDGKTFGDHMAGVNITLEHWQRLVLIAENVAKHTDYARVDLFYNSRTGDVRVNEVEAFFQCHHTFLQFDRVAIENMNRLWVQGWKTYLKDGAEGAGRLHVALRPFSRMQMTVSTSKGANSLVRHSAYIPWWIIVAWPLSLCLPAVLWVLYWRRINEIPRSRSSGAVELAGNIS